MKLDHSTLDGLIEELRSPVLNESANKEDKSTSKDIVLVVEDNPEMNKFITQSLAAEYQVISAFDGQEGLEKALLFQPALIVTDIMMPKVSGVEMITSLRECSEMNETPILLLSAKADEELKLQLLEKSAQDFITKPFSERDLQIRIRNLIAVKKSHDALRDAENTKRHAVEVINHELQLHSRQLRDLF